MTNGDELSAGTPHGRARRRELLDRVTDDLAVDGLVGFSLRRAAAGGRHRLREVRLDPPGGGNAPGCFAQVVREFAQDQPA
jgi:hypothetical protein